MTHRNAKTLVRPVRAFTIAIILSIVSVLVLDGFARNGSPPLVVAGLSGPDGIGPLLADEGGWQPTGGPSVPGGRVDALSTHPTRSGVAYAAVAPVGAVRTGPSTIYRTTSAGGAWHESFLSNPQVYSLAAVGDLIMAGVFNPSGEGPGIFVSRDGGIEWEAALIMSERGVWPTIVIHPGDASIAVAGGMRYSGSARGALLYRTTDAGRSWVPEHIYSYPDGSGSVGAVAFHPRTTDHVIAAIYSENRPGTLIFRSDDGGDHWSEVAEIANVQVHSLIAHQVNETTFYAGTGRTAFTWGQGSVFRSEDSGDSWTVVLPEAGGHLAFGAPSTVYALQGRQLKRSSADGDPGTWIDVGSTPDKATALAIEVAGAPPALVAGGEAMGLAASDNGGADWQPRNNGVRSGAATSGIAVSPASPTTLLAATLNAGGWRSTNAGTSWDQVGGATEPMAAFAYDPNDGAVAYGGAQSCGSGTILRSQSGGLSFTPVFTATFIRPDCSGGQHSIRSIAVANSSSGVVYAGGESVPGHVDGTAALYRSIDGGFVWKEVLALPASSYFDTVAIAPDDEDTVFVGGQDCSGPDCLGVVYRSLDGGAEWALVVAVGSPVRSIAIDPQKPEVVYFSTADYQIWKTTDGGDEWIEAPTVSTGPGAPRGDILVIDPLAPSHVYAAGPDYFGESADGGRTWSGPGDPLSNGLPYFSPLSLALVETGGVQTFYGGYSGAWKYERRSRTAGEPSAVSITLSRFSAPVGASVTVSALVADEHDNWVTDGTSISFDGSPEVTFGSGPTIVESSSGQAEAELTTLTEGTATITVTAGSALGTAQLEIGVVTPLYLPRLELSRGN